MIKWLLKTPPMIGSTWRFWDDENNPFESPSAVVTDVKSGFVKYRWYWSTDGKYGSSMSIREFRFVYKECHEDL